MRTLFSILLVVAVASCGGNDQPPSSNVTSGTIVAFDTQECFCCPSVTIEADGKTYVVDEFPHTTLQQSDLPVTQIIEISPYLGECPNRQVSVVYFDE